MTSFIIDSHINRSLPNAWANDCPFCSILKGELPSHKIYEDDLVMAFLDILPLRPGHTLVVPKLHVKHLSDLPEELAAAVGVAVTKVAKAITLAMNNEALNVVCNQEYAQAVPHVHYHIIPAPTFESSQSTQVERQLHEPPTQRAMHRMEFEARRELDENEGETIAEKIRARL